MHAISLIARGPDPFRPDKRIARSDNRSPKTLEQTALNDPIIPSSLVCLYQSTSLSNASPFPGHVSECEPNPRASKFRLSLGRPASWTWSRMRWGAMLPPRLNGQSWRSLTRPPCPTAAGAPVTEDANCFLSESPAWRDEREEWPGDTSSDSYRSSCALRPSTTALTSAQRPQSPCLRLHL